MEKIEDLFETSTSIVGVNNDYSTGGQHGIIINLSDKDLAEKLSGQIQELIKSLKK